MQRFKNWWTSFHKSFHDSETILWARTKVAIGLLLMTAMSFDMSQIITDPYWLFAWKVASVWLLADGGFSEGARRFRATDLGQSDGGDDEISGKAQ